MSTKLAQSKSSERLFRFYKLHFGFHEPYTVLMDGNSLLRYLRANQDYRRIYRKIARDTVWLKVTQCLLKQLAALPHELQPLLKEAQSLPRLSCGHVDGLTPKDCILDLVGQGNDSMFMVCTQDQQLIKALLQLVNVPVFYVGDDLLTRMREPTREAKAIAERLVAQRGGPAPQQHELFAQDRQEEKQQRNKEWLQSILSERHRLCIKIKKKAKGPNPLSCKQRRRRRLEGEQRRRRRKRPRSKKIVEQRREARAQLGRLAEQQ